MKVKTLRQLISEQEGSKAPMRPAELNGMKIRTRYRLEGAELILYRGGYIRYRRGSMETAFHVTAGKHFCYCSEKGEVLYGPKDFMDQPWTLFAVLCGEQRLEENQRDYDKRFRLVCVAPETIAACRDLLSVLCDTDPILDREPEDLLMEKETGRDVLAKLTPQQRRYFIESYLEGKTRREIAAEWGCSPQALSQINTRIRKKMEKLGWKVMF